jgi:hypothetical protein
VNFKLIIIMVEDARTKDVINAARQAGATGCTVLNQARGEGATPHKTFLGLSMESQVDVVLLLSDARRSRKILEEVARAGEFDETSGTGIAIELDVEDAIGVKHQVKLLRKKLDEEA